ncbi:MAG: DUF559 domain-containing protein [Solirubrobacterales bacterium]|nr:DUF559 domain-containing protein [Solirubrobacterales bacterium]
MEKGLADLKKLYRFMSTRLFVASVNELTEAGFGYSKIKNWYQRGRLVKVIRGVYSLGRDVESTDAALRAALLFAGPGAALTGASACLKWGFIKSRETIPRYMEIATPHGHSRKKSGTSPAMRHTVISVLKRNLRPDEVRVKDGLALVRPALALIDFAVNASKREVRFAFLEACRLRLFTEEDLKYCFNRMTRRRGARKLRPFLALWVPELLRIKSVLEGWFLLEWVERALEMPEVNVKTFGYEVDCLWRKLGVVLELDGDAFHSDPAQKALDLEKQRFLESRGLIVIRVTYAEFAADPGAVIERVIAVLEARRTALIAA